MPLTYLGVVFFRHTELTLHPLDDNKLAMVFNCLNAILNSNYKNLIEKFCVCVHQSIYVLFAEFSLSFIISEVLAL